jgi:uncharacterized RDD family membrane protein YckC
MKNDSVREELETQIKPGVPRTMERSAVQPARLAAPVKQPRVEVAPRVETAAPRVETVAPRVEIAAKAAPRTEVASAARPAPATPRITQEFHSPKTSPTLVEFQAKQTTVPDWRLQLQNSVRQRRGSSTATVTPEAIPQQARLSTRGANALKAEPVAERKAEAQSPLADPRVAAALKRIDHSRKTFTPPSNPNLTAAKSPAAREFPFNVVSRNAEPSAAAAPVKKATVNPVPRPKLIPTFKIEKGGYDTNKLPPLVAAPNPAAIDEPELELIDIHEASAEHEIILRVEETEIDEAETTAADESSDDIAPIAMRFNAGLFDVIIGAFASFILFSPLVFMGGDWFTTSGLLAFAATWAIVMFIYMTAAIGMYGRTVGMRMFSLEVIDAEENDYPTFHQAAVSAAVYLLTIPVLGLGFLPAFFNEEQRAAYDLASGTIVVTEF